MSFGKKSSPKPPPEVKPQIVVSPGSGSGLTDGTSTQQIERSQSNPSQASLLTDQEDDQLLKKGLG